MFSVVCQMKTQIYQKHGMKRFRKVNISFGHKVEEILKLLGKNRRLIPNQVFHLFRNSNFYKGVLKIDFDD
jgi:hypothetical protein